MNIKKFESYKEPGGTSFYNVYVIARKHNHSSLGVDERFFMSKAEAEKEIEQTEWLMKDKDKYEVITLSDFVMEVREDSYNSGISAERESY